MSLVVIIRKSWDLISLMFDLFNNNRKITLTTMVGLCISLIIISESFILIESSKQVMFDELVTDLNPQNDQNFCDISLNIYGYNPLVLEADRFTNFDHYKSHFKAATNRSEYDRYIAEYLFYPKNIFISIVDNITALNNIDFETITSSNPDFFNQVEDYLLKHSHGRFPLNSSEIILIRPNTSSVLPDIINSLTINSTITISSPKIFDDIAVIRPDEKLNKTVRIVGIIEMFRPKNNSINTYQTAQLVSRYLNYTWPQLTFLTTPSFLNEILSQIYPDKIFNRLQLLSSVPGESNYVDFSHMSCKIFWDYNQFEITEHPQKELQNIEKFLDSLTIEFESWGYNTKISCKTPDCIREYIGRESSLPVMFLMIGVPTFATSIYLTIYSLTLTKSTYKNQLAMIKTRGGSSKQIVTVLNGATIISTIIASIFSFITSIIIISVTMRSTNYLEFSGKLTEIKASIDMLLYVICFGVILAFLLNFQRIIRIAREEIEEDIVPFDKGPPFWKKYYLDIFMFISGNLIWSLLINLSRYSFTNISLTLIYISVGILIFLGAMLIIGRIFYFMINLIAKITWKRDWGIISLAAHNMVRYKHVCNRTALIFILALASSIISSSLVFSIYETEEITNYSRSGADISFSLGNEVSPLDEEAIHLIKKNVSQVISTSVIYTARGKSHPSISTREYHYKFLFVDLLTYGETVINYREFGLSGNLNTLLKELNSSDYSVLLYEKNSNALGKKIHSWVSLPIFSYYFFNNVRKGWYVVGTFDFWPNLLIKDPMGDYDTNISMIGSLTLFERMMITPKGIPVTYLEPSSIEARCLIKLNSTKNIVETVESINELTNYTYKLSVPSFENQKYKNSFEDQFNLSVLNTQVILSVIVAIICIIIFAFYIMIDRSKEIGIERVLGMTRFQTGLLFLFKTSLILCFGIFFGMITGIYFSTTYFQIIQSGILATPFVIVYPTQIMIILIVLFFITGIVALIPASIASKTEIGRILKVE